MLAQVDLERTVFPDLELIGLEIPPTPGATFPTVIAVVGPDPEVVDAPSMPPDAILTIASKRSPFVVAIRVIDPVFLGLMHRPIEDRCEWVRIFNIPFQAQSGHATQIPEPLRALKRILRRIFKDHRTGSLKRATEISPGLSVQNTLHGIALL